MDDTKKTVLAILNDLTGEDLSDKLDDDLFATALMDSMDTVQMVLELEEQLGVQIPVSEFDRSQWATPNMITARVEELK
ncbi:D-alanine--poly(phosphoribitol) ligase subunit DltC [Lacticaseibacillus pabuli]|uniref:D-alanyl carrier protein n=1 Tax=Lacticaseibacillus pabuli TaxID=3025672 RepID=A0ABY7WU24_9LACO|nr:D-alanine--poly(phosphoribitol) ligase subunit DltC [Lacticaseibacillus sp. KACC 23028]WDF82958.1 D-alanine--poly(phosphoribitol) ligase subunit DltC [Lacticaseibacillus sp. KACC 23028]